MTIKLSREHGKFLSDYMDNPNNWADGFSTHPRLLTEIRDNIYQSLSKSSKSKRRKTNDD